MKNAVADLVQDFEIYPRAQMSAFYVSELAESIRSGAVLPPIVVDKQSKRVVDGLHRLNAHIRVFGPESKIAVVWKEYETEADILADAIQLNANHGRRMSKVDYVRCTHIGKRYGLTVERIASLVGLRIEKLEELKTERTAMSERGELVVLRAGLEHLAGKTVTDEQRRANNRSGWNVLFYASRLADLVEAQALDLDNEKLKHELSRLYTLLAGLFVDGVVVR